MKTGETQRRGAVRRRSKVRKLQRSSVKHPEISRECFMMDFISELYERNPILQC